LNDIPTFYQEKLSLTSNVNDRNAITNEQSLCYENYNETKCNTDEEDIDTNVIDEPMTSTNNELTTTNTNEKCMVDFPKKKRSRQKFSQCQKCLKTWNDIRSFKVHQSEPGRCPGKPWFKVLPGKKVPLYTSPMFWRKIGIPGSVNLLETCQRMPLE